MRTKRILSNGLLVALLLTLAPVIASSATKVTSGASCKIYKQKVTYQNKTYTCIKSGKKLVWSKGVPVVVATTTTTAALAINTLPDSTGYLNVSNCKLINGSNDIYVNQSFQQSPFRLRTNKPIRALIFPVDFPDLIGNSDPQKDFAYVADGVSDYFKQMSDGKVIFNWTIYPRFVRYGSTVADANLGGRTANGYWPFYTEATKLAKQTVDISSFDVIIYAPPLTTTRAQIAIGPAFVSSSSDLISATMLDGQSYDMKSPLSTVHEIGHLMGLEDLYNFEAANEAAANPGAHSANDLQFKYMGIFDLMNWAQGTGVELTAWNRWLIDLISDNQIRCLPASSTTTLLSPLEINGGIKGAVIPLSKTEAIVIESRRALRYDKNMGSESEGVLIYKVDTSISSGFGPMRVVGRPASTDIWFRDAPLKLNESRIVNGYTIEVIKSDEFGDVVKVSKN